MHGSSGGGGPGKKARIEIIPLIDVIFFLLATFVLFTLSLNKSDGVPVTLPATETGQARDRENSITISVKADGTLAWGKEEPITLDEFLTRLQQSHATTPFGRILINGDQNATFSQAVYVFDQVRIVGFEQVFIETRLMPPKKQE